MITVVAISPMPVPATGTAPSTHPPLRPQTHDKAERLIETLLREWAYCFPYRRYHHRHHWLQFDIIVDSIRDWVVCLPSAKFPH